MDGENLPNDFNIIIVGTGLSESILSGALSRIGKKVLHLDHQKHYGSNWSSFNLKAFESWIDNAEEETHAQNWQETVQNLGENETFVPINDVRKTTSGGEYSCFLPEKIVEETKIDQTLKENETSECEKTENVLTNADVSDPALSDPTQKDEVEVDEVKEEDKTPADNSSNIQTEKSTPKSEIEKNCVEDFYKLWRYFNLDISPKLMFSRGKLVELLITSNVCRYLEFRNVSRTLTLLDEGNSKRIAPVPCSRTDVFTSKFVTMIEKRMLMRVLTMCANYESHPEEYKEFENGRFVDFLAAKKLSKKLQHFIIHSISMVTEETGTLDGLKQTQKFLKSLGRYGNSAFLWPLYGVGELPQAFCRLSAVFGGTFCLHRSLAGFIVNRDTGKCVGVVDSEGQRLDCEQLILDECYLPDSYRIPFNNIVSRAIYVTESSLLPTETENVSLITIPPSEDLPSSRLIEVGPSCSVCPKNYYVVHAMTIVKSAGIEALPSPRSVFESTEKLLFKDLKKIDYGQPESVDETSSETENRPQVVWSSYFYMMSGGVKTSTIPDNVHVTRGPSMDLGFDETVQEAKRLFEIICPDEEFLPRAPNPDEIVYFDQDDEGYNTEGNGANPAQVEGDSQEEGDYQEDNSEVDAGSGEPGEQEEAKELSPNDNTGNLE